MARRITNAGYWLGRFAQLEADEIVAHHDIEAFCAPSGCHELVGDGFVTKMLDLSAEMNRSIGPSYNELLEYIDDKGIRIYRAYERCVSNILKRTTPEEFWEVGR